MNKIVAGLFAVLFLTATSVQAHCGKCGVGDKHEDAGAMASKKVEKLTEKLSLTDEQKGKVEAIVKEKLDKKHQLMEDKQKAMTALDEEFSTKMAGVLTPEQVTKWEEMKKDHDGGCPGCKGGKMCDFCKGKKDKKDKKDHDHKDHKGDKDHEGHDDNKDK